MQEKADSKALIEKIYSVLREELVVTLTKTETGLDIRLVNGQEFVVEIKEKE